MIEESGTKLVAVAMLAGLAVALDTYGWTVACATAGAFWAVTGEETKTKGHAAACMLRWVLVSVIFTELLVAMAAKHMGMQASLMQGPIAFLLAFWGERWRDVPGIFSRVIERISSTRKQP